MGRTGFLSEKVVLEMWAARPGPDTPLFERTATSRELAAKYKICYKTVQKIWRRELWAKVADCSAKNTQPEGQLAATDPEIDTGTAADVTADALHLPQ
eukprot:993157-Rhodomonas_salina.2